MAFRPCRLVSFMALLSAGSVLASPVLAAGGAEIASPRGAWTIEAGTLGSQSGPVPYCSISNEYSNDARLEFYGTNGRLAALKLDVPAENLTAEAAYDVNLSIPGTYNAGVRAISIDTKTLIVNVKSNQEILGALNDAPVLYLGYDEEKFAFSMSGVYNVKKQLDTCGSPVARRETVLPAVSATAQASQDPVRLHHSAQAEKAKAILQGKAVPAQALPDSHNFQPAEPGMPQINPYPVKDAQARPDVAVIAQRQSFITQAAASPVALYAPDAQGKRQLPAPNLPRVKVVDGLEPPVFDGRFVGAAAPQEMSAYYAPAAPVQAPKQDWQALKGSSMREVLELWSEKEGVQLIWNTADAFPVRDTIHSDNSFEEAVERVLQQYDSVSPGLPRPVGSLHINDATGERTLLIQSERA